MAHADPEGRWNQSVATAGWIVLAIVMVAFAAIMASAFLHGMTQPN